jgi:hypothetical protein
MTDYYDERMERIRGYDYSIYTPGEQDREWFDDGAIGIVRSGTTHVFYRGQGVGEFAEKDIPRFRVEVDNAIKGVQR